LPGGQKASLENHPKSTAYFFVHPSKGISGDFFVWRELTPADERLFWDHPSDLGVFQA